MKRKRNESHRSHLINPFSFFIILHFPSSHFNQLRIPRTSADTLRNELSNEVMLRIPTGDTRKVGLLKEGNELWFCDGWQEFVKDFSIGIDHFLVFNYEGDSTFTVHIIDLTACEIHYRCSKRRTFQVLRKPHHEGIKVNGDEYDHIESPEIVHSTSITSRDHISGDKEMNNVTECGRFGYPLWLRKYEGLMTAVTTAGFSLPKHPFFIAAIKPYNRKELNIPKPFGVEHFRCEVNQRKLIKLEAHDGRQWEVDCARYSMKWVFIKGWGLFAQDIGLQVGDLCVFELTNSKKFVLKVHVIKKSHYTSQNLHGDNESKKIWHLTSVKLKKSNEEVALLDIGDDQMISDEEDMHNEYENKEIPEALHSTSICSRESDSEDDDHKISGDEERINETECTPFGYPSWLRKYEGLINIITTAGFSIPKNPFFVAALKPYNFNKFLIVPIHFTIEHFGCEKYQSKVIKLEACNGRQWEVNCVRYKKQSSLIQGWTTFAQENGLQVGDICVFELSNAKQFVLKVHVVEKSHSTPKILHDYCHEASAEVTLLDSDEDNIVADVEEMHNGRESIEFGYPLWMRKYEILITAVTTAGISLPKNPFFIAAIKSYNLQSSKAILNVPKPFGKEHLRCKVNEGKFIKLVAPDGTQSEVYCLRDSVKFAFCQGWGMFAQDIGLNEEDICIFERTKVKKFVLKVHVVKRSHDSFQVLHDYHEHHHQECDSSGETSPEIFPSPSVSLKKSKVEITLLDSEDDQKVGNTEEMHNEGEHTKFGYPLWMRKYERLINIVTAAGISLPENPFFLAAIKPYNLHRGLVNMPKPFGQELLRCEVAQEIRHKPIQLEAPDGTLWGVDCCRDTVKFALCKGWNVFSRGIGLNVGDICIFELVNPKMYVVKVHIVKRPQFMAEE